MLLKDGINIPEYRFLGLFFFPQQLVYVSTVGVCLALFTTAHMRQEQENAGEIVETIRRFERSGFNLVAIKIVVPSKDLAQKHYHALKERTMFDGLCEFLTSGPVIAMVWEGEGVIKYGCKLIGATDPQKSEPGTIRGEIAKDEIALWFKAEELVSYPSKNNAEKWLKYDAYWDGLHP